MPADFSRIVRPGLIRGLTPAQAQELAYATLPARARAGDVVMQQGEKINGLFLLMDGVADILKQRPDGGLDLLNSVAGPTLLGELSLLTGRPHSATVRARTDCEFYILTRPQFARLLENDSIALFKLVVTMAEVLCGRLSRIEDKLLELLARPETVRPVAELNELHETAWAPDPPRPFSAE